MDADPPLIPLVERPERGRVVSTSRRVRLGDVGPDGAVRLDGVVRYLQDVARDDSRDAGLDGAWVVRRTTLAVTSRPRFEDEVALHTWCSGRGASWAERRTDVELGSSVAIRASALWVHLDARTGRPRRLPEQFDRIWGESAGGRRVRGRLLLGDPPASAERRGAFPLRRADLDVYDHVNNAVAWAAIEEELAGTGGRVRVVVEHREPIGIDDRPVRWRAPLADGWGLWLLAGSDVRVAALVTPSGAIDRGGP